MSIEILMPTLSPTMEERMAVNRGSSVMAFGRDDDVDVPLNTAKGRIDD